MKSNKQTLVVEFYKESWNFDISATDTFSTSEPQSIRRMAKLLNPLINTQTNIVIPRDSRNRMFIHEFIYFCKNEDIDYDAVLNFHPRFLSYDGSNMRIGILVTYGRWENVHELRI